MRRKDREITDMSEIVSILKRCKSVDLAFFDEKYPYIVPMNFGLSYENERLTLYFHCANSGKKLELMKKNRHVCFEGDCSLSLVKGNEACTYTMEFESVVGFGKAEIITENKLEALTLIMRQYSPAESYDFNERAVKFLTVFKIEVDSVTGKRLKK